MPLVDAWVKSGAEEFGARLDIVGPDDGQEAHVRSLADREPSINLRGRIDSSEVVGQMKRYTHLVVPSLTDTFPMVVLEALSSGLQVICRDTVEMLSDHPSIAEVVHVFGTDLELQTALKEHAAGIARVRGKDEIAAVANSFSSKSAAKRIAAVYSTCLQAAGR